MEKKLFPFLFGMAQEDSAPIVLCNLNHEIVYMNPAAAKHYARSGGADLVGKSLLACHGKKSGQRIEEVIHWFQANRENNRIYTFYNEEENKDVYMVALRDEAGNLIGYYEKHEYRDREDGKFYDYEDKDF